MFKKFHDFASIVSACISDYSYIKKVY